MSVEEKKKIQFSVAVITYNEEQNLKDCIQSFHEIADEVIILDSFSTDKTEEIARSFPKVTFHVRKFSGHIEQKNHAIELCSGEWILSLDADERVSPELCREIQDLLPRSDKKNGYKIPRLTYHMGRFIRHGGWYPLKRYRFFRKGFARWTGENPHDYIEIDGKGSSLKGDIIHYSFKDLSHQIDTINKFSSIVSFTRFKKSISFPLLKSLYKPFFKFIECYFLKLGFLDGYPGFVIAISSSFSTFLKFAKIYELKNNTIERPSNLRKDYGT
ncbi:MAG: glycosyltransferase family 2 protein [Leptospiraceae bacterium]|nr:glycosyltransferase family 2 protein [Leptospiraceae bacterium]MCP5511365.1 glycosyltransferase family 2 protein [Leptospiraceae bacterium]